MRARGEVSRSHLHQGEADSRSVQTRYLTIPGDVAVQYESQPGGGSDIPSPSITFLCGVLVPLTLGHYEDVSFEVHG